MTNRRLVLLGLTVALVLGALGYWRSDTRRIRAALAELVGAMEKTAPEDQLSGFGAARRISAAFADGFVVFAPPYAAQVTDRREVAAAVQTLRSSAVRVGVSTSIDELEIASNRGTAIMVLRATVTLAGPGRDPARETYRVRIDWVEEGGDWLVHRLELVEHLDGGGLF